MRSGNPLTVFVTTNRSRSQWNPSRGPGIGQDRPDYAPGYGPDNAVLGRVDQWFDPAAFVLQPAGTFGNTGRGDFTGPNLRTLDMALSKTAGWARLGGRARVPCRSLQSPQPRQLRRARTARVLRHRRPAGARHVRPHHQHDHVGAADSVGDQSGVLAQPLVTFRCAGARRYDGTTTRRIQNLEDFRRIVVSSCRQVPRVSGTVTAAVVRFHGGFQ